MTATRRPGQTIGNNPVTILVDTENKRGRADADAYKRSKNKQYARKIAEQPISKQENELHYQNESDWKGPRSDRERTEHRKLKLDK